MTKKLTLILTCLAFIVSGIAQPSPAAKFSERFQNLPSFENLRSFLPPKTIPQNRSEDWYEPDIVYLFDTNELVGHHTFSYESGKCMYHIMKYSTANLSSLKYIYSYDALNNFQEALAQEWDWDNERWENFFKVNYYYTQNNLNEMVIKAWAGGWIDFMKISYTYDAQNNLSVQLNQQTWDYDSKYTYLYDSQNNLSEELRQLLKWDQWENEEKYIYLYDSQNNLIEQQQYWWQSYSEEWSFPYKWIFTYDVQNNRTEELFQRSNVLNEWENDTKMSYTYDENNNASIGVCQKWENNTWIDEPYGSLNLHYNNMKSIWQYSLLHKFSATYINMNNQSIQDHSTESVIKLYPNPVSGIPHVETGNNIAPEIKVFSIQGVLLLQAKGNEIDISSLDRGIYFAEIDGVCRKVVRQ